MNHRIEIRLQVKPIGYRPITSIVCTYALPYSPMLQFITIVHGQLFYVIGDCDLFGGSVMFGYKVFTQIGSILLRDREIFWDTHDLYETMNQSPGSIISQLPESFWAAAGSVPLAAQLCLDTSKFCMFTNCFKMAAVPCFMGPISIFVFQ